MNLLKSNCMVNQTALTKLEKLEKEVLKLKKGGEFKLPKKLISLKGILKGVKITEKAIEKAKNLYLKKLKYKCTTLPIPRIFVVFNK